MKVLVGIVTCKGIEYQQRRRAQDDTWVRAARARGWNIEVFDGERLNTPDDYAHLHLKRNAMCVFAKEHGYDAVVKSDDDTWINLDKWVNPTADYCGLLQAANDYGCTRICGVVNSPVGTWPFPYASGGCYWMSRKAFEVIATVTPQDWAEDREAGHVLAKAGMPLVEHPGFVCGVVPDAMVCMQVGAREMYKLPSF